jgi:hypothetical protein
MTDQTPSPASQPTLLDALRGSSAQDIIALLFRFELAEPFFRALKEREIVFNAPGLSSPDQIHVQALETFKTRHQLLTEEDLRSWSLRHGLTTDDLLSEAIHELRLEQLRDRLLGQNRESLYLRYKQKLDRVLYSLLRHSDADLVRHLYYSIDAGEISFREAARQHSQGIEAKTEGIVGPVDLTTPHPEIASRLLSLRPGELSEPFVSDSWHVIVRLEYRYDSVYDDDTKRYLGDICLNAFFDGPLQAEYQQIIEWVFSS